MRAALLAVAGVCLLLAACGDDPAVSEGSSSPGSTSGSSLVLKAESVLPPGQSGFFSVDGQVQGSLSGAPADYGAHVDDQRLLYWNFDAKPGALGTKPGTPTVPKSGIEIYRDSYGVPIVYAGNVHDLWFGVGYAVAQDRLFLMDAVRRTGRGTLAELTGCGTVPADIQQRVVTYSSEQYQQMFDRLSVESKDMVLGYVDGANAWLDEVLADPSLVPAEYALLSSVPQPFTVQDVLAAGVYITRFVASEGGNESLNIQMLKQLEIEYGSRAEALKAFQDMTWLEDRKAVTSVPLASGEFSNHVTPSGGRDAAFASMAAWALDSAQVPETVWKGEGTGHAPLPQECELIAGNAPARGRTAVASRNKRRQLQAQLATLNEGLAALRRKPTGASFAFAVGPSRTRGDGTLLISAPQLGYSYPLLLVEYEVHGAGYDARGTSVPILPTVGIGYTPEAAWGLTTGYSKTIDSFIETLCSTAQQTANTCDANQYFHNGAWKDMACRTETVNYRLSSQGLPFGPSAFSTDVEVCNTVHGPIVARDDAGGRARSVQYAMYGREVETIEGIREWNKAKSFAEFAAGVAKVTWNENVTVATRDGHIGFFHPGLHMRRHPLTDQRLPIPGTGAFDMAGLLTFAETPKVIDPPQGYVANWNNKPAFGWLDGEGMGSTSRPGGPGQRVTSLLDKLATRSNWTFADLREIDIHAGTTDPRAREYLPVIQAFRASAASSLSEVEKAALDLILAWDRKHYGAGINPADSATWVDSAGATLFGEYVNALRDELFGGLKDNVLDGVAGSSVCGGAPADPTVYGRVAGVGSHLFDQSVMDNLVLRVLDPATSSLAIRRDYTGGRSRDAVMAAALAATLQRVDGAPLDCDITAPGTLAECRRKHPPSYLPSLTGVIGPGSTTPTGECVAMPYQDRGSWVHRAGYE
ncbi:MAG: penicillin acylase family protein [Pseudomonadota bacterium]